MLLIEDFGAYKPRKGYNEWGVRRKDNANCRFPPYRRITELGFQILGTTKEGEHIFRGSERLGKNWLILKILPKTSRKDIKALVAAIGAETK